MNARDTGTIGLALIARDEEETLPRLLRSVAGCFDQVVLLDTGSTDRTVDLFETWAAGEAARRPGFKARLDRTPWRDDFAAARNASYALLDTAWCVWADPDDAIHGADRLRDIAKAAPADIMGLVATYHTVQASDGGALCHTQRIRLTRAGAARWMWPVHEALAVEGRLGEIPTHVARWVHAKEEARIEPARGRNLRILHRWLEQDPHNLRALAHTGREEAATGSHERAVHYFRRFVDSCDKRDEELAQVRRGLTQSLIALGRVDEAAEDAAEALAEMPSCADTHLAAAEVALARGENRGVVTHATQVLELGPPPAALLQVTTDYTARPRLMIAQALAAEGDANQSRRFAEQALAAISGANLPRKPLPSSFVDLQSPS